MRDSVYQSLVSVLDLFLWGGELVGEERLPLGGPAVFIANHLAATGPIAVTSSIPLRMYSWTVADMLDKEKAAAWLKWDFVERTLHLNPPLSGWMAKALSGITVPLLRSLGCIPVYKGDYEQMAETLRLSMDVLQRGKCVLIFPEDATLAADPETNMNPFQHSFVRLGEMYFAKTGQRLEFYPVAVHPAGYVLVGEAVSFDPLNAVGLERHRLKALMEDTIRAMYMQVGAGTGQGVGVLTPQRK